MDTQPLFENVKQRAFELRLPIYKLCERAGVSNSTVWRWEKLNRAPSISIIGKLESKLDEIEAERKAA